MVSRLNADMAHVDGKLEICTACRIIAWQSRSQAVLELFHYNMTVLAEPSRRGQRQRLHCYQAPATDTRASVMHVMDRLVHADI